MSAVIAPPHAQRAATARRLGEEQMQLALDAATSTDPSFGARAYTFIVEFVREQSARLNFAARAQTAAALLLAGEPRQALPLLESLALPVSRARVPGRLFDSDVRDAALLLSAWLDVDPENAVVARLAQYLREAPKRRSAPLVSKKMLTSVIISGLYMTIVGIAFYKSAWVDHLFRDADNHIYTYTGFFCAYIFMAVANGFNVRTDGLNLLKNISLDKGFLQVMALIVAIQVLLTFVGGRVLRTTPLNAHEWGVVVLFGASIIVVDLLRKLISSR